MVEDEVGGETEEAAKEEKDDTMDTTAGWWFDFRIVVVCSNWNHSVCYIWNTDSTTEAAKTATGNGDKDDRKRPRDDDDRRKDSRGQLTFDPSPSHMIFT